MDTPLTNTFKFYKKEYPAHILFIKAGDFYEAFYEDAFTISNLTGAEVISRSGAPNLGVPYHAASEYVCMLLRRGYKVAVIEQIHTPGEKCPHTFKTEVQRDIVFLRECGLIEPFHYKRIPSTDEAKKRVRMKRALRELGVKFDNEDSTAALKTMLENTRKAV